MSSKTELKDLALRFDAALHLSTPPISIALSDLPLDGFAPFEGPMAEAGSDRRAGRVPAGCVFWMKAAENSFSTVSAYHGSCGVGSFTHGFITLNLNDAVCKSDLASLLGSGWVDEQAVAAIPFIDHRYYYVNLRAAV